MTDEASPQKIAERARDETDERLQRHGVQTRRTDEESQSRADKHHIDVHHARKGLFIARLDGRFHGLSRFKLRFNGAVDVRV